MGEVPESGNDGAERVARGMTLETAVPAVSLRWRARLKSATTSANVGPAHAQKGDPMPETMRAAVFKDVRDIHIEEVPQPRCGPTDAIVKVTTTTICGTDSHIWRGEYPVASGRIVGHEPAGVVHEVGDALHGYQPGDRVVVGAITPCGSCYFCQAGDFSQCAGYEDQWGIIGG